MIWLLFLGYTLSLLGVGCFRNMGVKLFCLIMATLFAIIGGLYVNP